MDRLIPHLHFLAAASSQGCTRTDVLAFHITEDIEGMRRKRRPPYDRGDVATDAASTRRSRVGFFAPGRTAGVQLRRPWDHCREPDRGPKRERTTSLPQTLERISDTVPPYT